MKKNIWFIRYMAIAIVLNILLTIFSVKDISFGYALLIVNFILLMGVVSE